MSHLRAASILLALLCTPAQAQDKVEARTYDLREDLRELEDRKPQSLGLNAAAPHTEPFAEEDDRPSLDSWRELLLDNVDSETWEGERAIRRFAPGMLRITASPRTHARIAALLAAYRARRGHRARLELTVYQSTQAAASQLLAGGPLLDAPRLARLAQAPWTTVRRRTIDTYLAQGTARGAIRRIRYVRSYTCEVAQASAVYEPEVDLLTLGRQDFVRPLLSVSGRGLIVRCHIAAASAATPPPRFDTGIVSKKRIKLVVEQPVVHQRAARTTVYLPQGRALIVQARAEGDAVQLAVLRHHPRNTPPVKPRQLHLFDVRALLDGQRREVTGFICGLGVAPPRKPDGIIIDREDDEAGDGMHIDRILELLRTHVAPDSWEEAHASLDSLDGQLLVRNTPRNLERVRATLHTLDARLARTVFVRTRTIQPTTDARRTWLADRAGEALSPADRKLLEAALTSAKDLRRLDDLGIATMENRRAVIEDATTRPYVYGYDVEIAELSSAYDPEIQETTTGSALAIHPVARGKRLRIDLRRDRATLRSLKTVPTGGVMVQTPDTQLTRINRDLDMVSGSALLLSADDGSFLVVEAFRIP